MDQVTISNRGVLACISRAGDTVEVLTRYVNGPVILCTSATRKSIHGKNMDAATRPLVDILFSGLYGAEKDCEAERRDVLARIIHSVAWPI